MKSKERIVGIDISKARLDVLDVNYICALTTITLVHVDG
jgi:hypothetical protein